MCSWPCLAVCNGSCPQGARGNSKRSPVDMNATATSVTRRLMSGMFRGLVSVDGLFHPKTEPMLSLVKREEGA